MKVAFAVLFLFFQSTLFIFAKVGIGVEGGYDFSSRPAFFVSATARSDQYPWCISINSYPQKNMISVFADNLFVNERISSHFEYFVFWGVSAGFLSRHTDRESLMEVSTGCRCGAGVDFFMIDRHINLFVKGSWSPYFGIKKYNGDWKPLTRPLSFPCSGGLRVWL